jgi:hypothetical protein
MALPQKWEKIMNDPVEVIRQVIRDYEIMTIYGKILPKGEAEEIRKLENYKGIMEDLDKKFAKTDYHKLSSKRLEKDSLADIRKRMDVYGIKLTNDEIAFLSRMKQGAVPKEDSVNRDLKSLKKDVKKRYKTEKTGELNDIVIRGSDIVAAIRLHSSQAKELGEKRLKLEEKMYSVLDNMEKMLASKTLDFTAFSKLAEEEKKIKFEIEGESKKIALLEKRIQMLQGEAEKVVGQFVILSESLEKKKEMSKTQGVLAG